MAVFDANVLVGLIVDLPWSAAARQAVVTHSERRAPSLLPVEVGSALWKNVRSGILRPDDAGFGLDGAMSLVTLIQVEELVDEALRLAIDCDQPIYDCLYVALARREDALLVTADGRLAALAERVGVKVEAIT